MAPELLGNGVFSAKVDVYAFGVLLWELYHAQVPFRSFDVMDIKRAVEKGERPEVDTHECPPDVAAVVAACWHAEPNRRPSFRAIVDDLRSVERALPRQSFTCDISGGDALDALMG